LGVDTVVVVIGASGRGQRAAHGGQQQKKFEFLHREKVFSCRPDSPDGELQKKEVWSRFVYSIGGSGIPVNK